MFVGPNYLLCCVMLVGGRWCSNVLSCLNGYIMILQELNVVFRLLHCVPIGTWCENFCLAHNLYNPFCLVEFFWNPNFLLSCLDFVKPNFSSCLYSLKPKLHIVLPSFVKLHFSSCSTSKTQTSPFHSSSLQPHHLLSYSTFWNPNFTSSFIFFKTSTPFIMLHFLKPELHFLIHIF